jgi:Baseplate J-like protein
VSAASVTPTRDSVVTAELLRNLRGYTPEWLPVELGAGYAMLQAYARLAGIVDQRLKQVPERDLLAYFDMLGLHLLPASAARAPLVFAVAADSPVDVTLPAGSQVAASPPQSPPTLGAPASPPPDPIVFATETTVTLTPGHLKSLYSIDPGSDAFTDHSASTTTGLTLFDQLELTPHHLYLGHDQLFALGGNVSLILSFVLDRAAQAPVSLAWEYFTQAGWIPLPYELEDDTTGGLTADGQVTLHRDCGPNAMQTTVAGLESFWIRARLTTPLQSAAIAPLVVINDIRARVGVTKDGLQLDAAFADAVALDVSKDFFPFGASPTLASAFYLSCKDAFARRNANVKIAFDLSKFGGPQSSLALEWEYSTDDGWAPLTVMPQTPAYLFEKNGAVLFASPADWAEREVNGTKQLWLRARISAGNFGLVPYVSAVTAGQPVFAGGNLAPPIVRKAPVSFQYLTDPETLDHCVAYNDFLYEDVTEAARWPDSRFVPFVPVSDRAPAVHFGFDHSFPDGLASLFVDVTAPDAVAQTASPFVWEYRAAADWRELAVLDETQGFQASGMLQFVGPQDAALVAGLGGDAYWLRARLKQGESMTAASINGLWLNAVWASQRSTVQRELAGRSDGNPGQSFQLTRSPILLGEVVEVQEWTGKGDAWQSALPNVSAANVRFEKDPASGDPTAAWVRWCERPNFFSSVAGDRHYVIERATGVIRFGATVPSAGRRITVSYASGGGLAGNMPVGVIKQLRTAAPYVNSVTNVLAAQGGADREEIAAVHLRGPQHLRHRDRGIAARDLEWLALEASPEVARVRCLSITGSDGCAQRGWVTLLVVPDSLDAQPVLTQELVHEVRQFLLTRVPAGMRVRIVGPQYALVTVRATIVPQISGEAALVEARIRTALDTFLHPLHGGRDGGGWRFGEPVYLSHVAAIVRGVSGVEHAEAIELMSDGVLSGMTLAIASDRLVAAGSHELLLRAGAL